MKKREESNLFQKIDQYNQVLEDSERMVLIMSSKVDHSKGQKPSSRAYFGCVYSHEKIYFFAGKNNEIMNDLRSLNFKKMEWKHEDSHNHSLDNNRAILHKEKVFEVETLKERFSCSMVLYKHYLFVFGGGGSYIDSL